jgi:glutathione peroxidase
VIGFPCNQFGGQEPSSDAQILPILANVVPGGGYAPHFPLTNKTDVNGALIHPVWTMIKNACPPVTTLVSAGSPPWSPIQTNDISWNFYKVRRGRGSERWEVT